MKLASGHLELVEPPWTGTLRGRQLKRQCVDKEGGLLEGCSDTKLSWMGEGGGGDE